MSFTDPSCLADSTSGMWSLKIVERAIGPSCTAVLCILLVLGLWPLHVPKNDVTWLQDTNGIRFARYSTALSYGEFRPREADNRSSATIEIWLRPERIWEFGTFLAFYRPYDRFCFSLHQWQTGLLMRAAQDFYVNDVFPRRAPAFLTITVGEQGTIIYVNGAVVKRVSDFRISTKMFSGRLILANSPRQSDSWKGQLLALAIYNRELAANEVLDHFRAWTKEGKQKMVQDQSLIARYLFNEHKGSTIHNDSGSGPDLGIPKNYTVLDQMFLETPWSEFSRSTGFWSAALKNIIGFIPLGFSFYPYFSLIRQYRRPGLITVVLGFAVSLTIEAAQRYLPNRDSGAMDLITNTLGTQLGLLAFRTLVLRSRVFSALGHSAFWPKR